MIDVASTHDALDEFFTEILQYLVPGRPGSSQPNLPLETLRSLAIDMKFEWYQQELSF